MHVPGVGWLAGWLARNKIKERLCQSAVKKSNKQGFGLENDLDCMFL